VTEFGQTRVVERTHIIVHILEVQLPYYMWSPLPALDCSVDLMDVTEKRCTIELILLGHAHISLARAVQQRKGFAGTRSGPLRHPRNLA